MQMIKTVAEAATIPPIAPFEIVLELVGVFVGAIEVEELATYKM